MDRKGEPNTQWPYEEESPSQAAPEVYQLKSERLDDEERQKEAGLYHFRWNCLLHVYHVLWLCKSYEADAARKTVSN